MTFKDFVARDNLTVFINPDEFADLIEFSSPGYAPKELMAVVAWDENATPIYDYAEGTYSNKGTLFMREEDLGYRPAQNKLVYFSVVGRKKYPYTVTFVRADMGILEVRIEANKA